MLHQHKNRTDTLRAGRPKTNALSEQKKCAFTHLTCHGLHSRWFFDVCHTEYHFRGAPLANSEPQADRNHQPPLQNHRQWSDNCYIRRLLPQRHFHSSTNLLELQFIFTRASHPTAAMITSVGASIDFLIAARLCSLWSPSNRQTSPATTPIPSFDTIRC